VLVAPVVIIPNDFARVLYFAFILVLWHNCINPDRSEIEENERIQELQPITRSVWSMREPYRPNSQVNTSFGTIAEIARLAIRALPPVKSFDGEETVECPICLEEFNKGELIQSFGVCTHEFHISCLNSWLLGGKNTCPVCRQVLLSNH
jgi:hypothetical protein